MAITEDRVRHIHSEKTLFEFLHDELHWPHADAPDTYPFFADELGLTDDEATQIKAVRQIAPFQIDQPWGIFLVEFQSAKSYQGILRRVLRGLSETRRDRDAGLPAWKARNLLFICTSDFREFSFARFEGQTHTRAPLSIFGWDAGGSGLRTLCEFNLPALHYPLPGTSPDDWLKHWAEAWNVEKVTEKFYREYEIIFGDVEKMITGVKGDKRLFTQRLFNRLMFIQFLSKKHWLRFGENHDGTNYLQTLWRGRDKTLGFYSAHILPLFFTALNNRNVQRDLVNDPFMRSRIGMVPYLNGGLFQRAKGETGEEIVPDDALDRIINQLFARFNFTIHESTPLEIEVAVDPEMLGKVFEELVTGRHKSGSYYTPRPVVSFMCKEALKGYLGGCDALIDRHDAPNASVAEIQSLLAAISVPEATTLLQKLADVKVVDPACGSGAYLLGMLHELFALNRLLDTRAEQASARDDHKRKLDIIRNNIYGVDLEEFAVQIARLRLWLSLAVEFEGDVPEPLPNLDFKIEQGDSLSAPDPQGGPTADIFRQKDIEEFSTKKADYADPYYTLDKDALLGEIVDLRRKIAAWAHPKETVQGFDWRVEFAEVFEPQVSTNRNLKIKNGGGVSAPTYLGGFDIALQNPPYIRQEEIVGKPHLQKVYTDGIDGKSDLYCYFYIRALQLLRPGGIQIFIVSNSWLDVGYGGKLQGYLLRNSHVQTIYDSAVERQFATADINTIISVIRKGKPADNAITKFVSLRAPFDQAITDPAKRRELERTRGQLWEAGLGDADKRGVRQYEGDKWGGKYLRAPDIFWKILERGYNKLVRLGTIAQVRFGIKTGANDFFYVRVLSVENGIAHIRCDDKSEHLIESEYVSEPVLVYSREIIRPHIIKSELDYRLVRLDESAFKKIYARRYIQWGMASRKDSIGKETGQFHLRPSCANRKPWYKPDERDTADIFIPIGHNRRPVVGYSPGILASDNLVEVSLNDKGTGRLVAGCVLGAFTMLLYEITGRANFGQGLLKTQTYEIADLLVLDPKESDSIYRTVFEDAYETIAKRPPLMIYDEVKRNDRTALDDAFLFAIGFNDPIERGKVLAELHEATCRRVWERQAKSEKMRESRQTYDAWLASGLPFGNVDEE